MVRWFKIIGNQYFGFWFPGLVLFAVQELPYLLMPFINPKTNPIMHMHETSALLDLMEKISGSLCIALMIFVIHKDAELFSVSSAWEKIFFGLTLTVLAVNFTGWGLYYTGHQSLLVMMLFIVAMPPLYYITIGLWRRNLPLAVTGMIFFAIHFSHVLQNLKS
jgi:hypothetical protein